MQIVASLISSARSRRTSHAQILLRPHSLAATGRSWLSRAYGACRRSIITSCRSRPGKYLRPLMSAS